MRWHHQGSKSILDIRFDRFSRGNPFSWYRDFEDLFPELRMDKEGHPFRRIVEVVYQFSRISEGDLIVAISEKEQESCLGRVEEVEFLLERMHIRISWYDGNQEWRSVTGPTDKHPLFIAEATLELMDQFDIFSKLSEYEIENFQIQDSNVLTIMEGVPNVDPVTLRDIGALLNSPSSLKNLAEEGIHESADDDLMDIGATEPETIPSHNVTLFYGTNRKKTGETDLNGYYGSESGELTTGICKVNVPSVHVQGRVERPRWWKLQFRENDDKHITLKDISEVETEQFYADLADDMAQLDNKAALIFIHGYNNSFAKAARRAGQIAFDIPFDGLAGFYSWPSMDNAAAYERDEDLVELAVSPFKKFVIDFIEKTGVEKLHFIAHSMGNRLLCTTLNEISIDGNFGDKLKVLHQVVLAAPDIDQRIFKERILPEFQKVGIRRTLYPSPYDMALNFSEIIRVGNPRLGDSGDSIFVEKELDTVDTDSVKIGGINHSNVFDTKELLTDLHYLLNEGLHPDRRRLVKLEKETKPYWTLPR